MAVEVSLKKGAIWGSRDRVMVAEAWVENAVRSLNREIKRLKLHVEGPEPFDTRLAVYYARKCTHRSLREIAEFFGMEIGAAARAINVVEEQDKFKKVMEEACL